MTKYSKKAQALRNDENVHYNCAQAVLMAFCADAGVGEELGKKIASNFGSGMKCGSICGAVTGGLMALGLFSVEDAEAVKEYYARVKESIGEDTACAALLKKNAEAGGNKKVFCDGLITACADIVADILSEKGKI